jgi:hypothetical protein
VNGLAVSEPGETEGRCEECGIRLPLQEWMTDPDTRDRFPDRIHLPQPKQSKTKEPS